MDSKDWRVLLVLTLIATLYIFSVRPLNLPLNDDIIYYESVENFVTNGSLVSNQPYIASIYLQIFYGATFVAVLGLSHATLMLSMMVAGVLTVIASYFLFRTRLDAEYSLLGSLLLLTNPLFYNLSHTFMTDVFALLFMITSATCFLRFLQNKNYRYFAAAIVLATAGFWVRQYAVMTAAGFALYLFLQNRKLLLQSRILIPLVGLPLISIVGWAFWFYGFHDQSYVCPYPLALGSHVVKNIAQLFLYTGYFLFPLGLIFVVNWKQTATMMQGKTTRLVLAMVSFLILAVVILRANLTGDYNIFAKGLAGPSGIGALTISGIKPALFFPELVWPLVIVLSLITALATVAVMTKYIKENLASLLMGLAICVPPLLFVAFHDRYYIFLLPIVLLAILPVVKELRYGRQLLIASIVLLGAWSWYGTYDYHAWNTARWEGIDYLLDRGVPEEEIDGGMEFDERFFDKCTDRSAAVNWHGWGYSISDHYVISFSPLNGYSELETIDYHGPIGEKLGSIYVLEKEGL